MSETSDGRNSRKNIANSEVSERCGARAAWMAELARAPGEALRGRLAALLDAGRPPRPAWRWRRPPEIGLIMTRGRIGGEGAPFNLGETTVTRCTLRLETGEEGVAYILGRDPDKAEAAALADALLQGPAAETLQQELIAPLAAERRARQAEAAARADETVVEFFTLMRGETE